jgi:hypothetical protein
VLHKDLEPRPTPFFKIKQATSALVFGKRGDAQQIRRRQVLAHHCRCAAARWNQPQSRTGQRRLVLVVSEVCAEAAKTIRQFILNTFLTPLPCWAAERGFWPPNKIYSPLPERVKACHAVARCRRYWPGWTVRKCCEEVSACPCARLSHALSEEGAVPARETGIREPP